ncbi:MAG: hypothetical protein ACYTF1_10805, partial [Planctomycetota bacterium]
IHLTHQALLSPAHLLKSLAPKGRRVPHPRRGGGGGRKRNEPKLKFLICVNPRESAVTGKKPNVKTKPSGVERSLPAGGGPQAETQNPLCP